MKNFFILLFVMALFASCEKEELSSLETEASSQGIEEISAINNESSVSTTEVKAWTTWVDMGHEYYCAFAPTNCMPEVIVRAPEKFTIVNEFFQTIQEEKFMIVEEYIESNFEELSEMIETSDLDKVLSRELTLTVKPYNDEGKRYLLFSSKEEVVKVYPFE